jgi:hypothetical protein
MSWRDAFLKQARSDYLVSRHLNTSHLPLCHQLHYLQMASEKLAKAYLCRPGGSHPGTTHHVQEKMLRVLKGRPDVRRELGFGENYHAYCAYIDSLISVAKVVENLAPAGGDCRTMNPEYPWADTSGQVLCPAEYDYPELAKTDVLKFRQLICGLLRAFGTPVC